LPRLKKTNYDTETKRGDAGASRNTARTSFGYLHNIGYFHNSSKYFGELLKRMIEQGYITRSRPDGSQNPRGAFYSISKKGRIKRDADTPNPNQQKLF